jgi:hypothetical protein
MEVSLIQQQMMTTRKKMEMSSFLKHQNDFFEVSWSSKGLEWTIKPISQNVALEKIYSSPYMYIYLDCIT